MHNSVFPLFYVFLVVVFFFSILALSKIYEYRFADNVCAIQGKQTYTYHGFERPCPHQESDQ